jgi:DNA ligase D-like protein (predicted ligase)
MNYSPMSAKTGTISDLQRNGYIYEPKLDGIRAIYYSKRNEFINRRNNNITKRYPELLNFGDAVRGDCVLDGEIVVYDKNGMPDFNLLLNREQTNNAFLIEMRSKNTPATFVVFDILKKNKEDLTGKDLLERKRILEETISEGKNLQLIGYTTEGKKLWDYVTQKNLEGVMAKRVNSVYVPGKRNENWLKIKHIKSIDCIILGYTFNENRVRSIAIGVFRDKDLVFIGRVGSGFSQKIGEELYSKLSQIKTTNPIIEAEGMVPTLPEYVCEVDYMHYNPDGRLRATSFMRLRDDKDPTDCTFDQLSV